MYEAFLSKLISSGIQSVSGDSGIKAHPKRLAGAIAGFKACAGLAPEKLAQLLVESNRKTHNAHIDLVDKRIDNEDYWEARHFAIQVEWVCNCVSVVLIRTGKPAILTPTARGADMAERVLRDLSLN